MEWEGAGDRSRPTPHPFEDHSPCPLSEGPIVPPLAGLMPGPLVPRPGPRGLRLRVRIRPMGSAGLPPAPGGVL